MSCQTLLANNRRWVTSQTTNDPQYFARLARTHQPKYLFIGCSDARVPADLLTQTSPGELFVHRNIANLVVPTDNNLLAVLQYAVEVLGVQEIMVCGHDGCGGVNAALSPSVPPLVDNWLSNIRTVARLHADELDAIPDQERRSARLVELNVMEQVYNLCRTPVIQTAWARRSSLTVHGWVYATHEGVLRDLHVTMNGQLIDTLPATPSKGGVPAGTLPKRSVRREDELGQLAG